MSTTQHPLTDAAIAEMWESGSTNPWSFRGMHLEEQDATLHAMRAAFDAGRKHEREHGTQDRPAEITDEMVEAAAREIYVHDAPSNDPQTWPPTPDALADDYRGAARATLSAALAVATPAEPLARTLLAVPDGYGAPHHDADRIKAGDYVAQVDDSDFIRAGIAHRRDEAGDWMTEGGVYITWAAVRAAHPDALTVWPAPTPPAEEVEWEPQFGDVIYDVEVSGLRFPGLVFDGSRWCSHGARKGSGALTACTLPDGTRARRDGEHEDGTPRFIKVEADA